MLGVFRRKRGPDLLDTAEMAAFFDKLSRMNQVQFLTMRAAWQSLGHRAHEDAWTAVRAAAARDGLSDAVDRVRAKAYAWATRATDVYPYATTNNDLTAMQVRMDAGEAIVDAALAVALGSRLDRDIHDLLIGPWLSATESFDGPVVGG